MIERWKRWWQEPALDTPGSTLFLIFAVVYAVGVLGVLAARWWG